MRDLEARARELLVVQTLGEVPNELSLTAEIDTRLAEQAARVSAAEVVRVLDLVGAALESVRAGAEPRTQLELALVKAASPRVDGSTPALLARIERLEQALLAGTTAAEGQLAAPTPVVAAKLPGEPSPSVTTIAQPTPADSPAPTSGAADDREPPAEAEPTPPPALASVGDDPQTLWPAVLDAIRAEHKLLRAFFNEAMPTSVSEEQLTVSFAPTAAFNKRKAEEPENRRILLDTLHRLTGRRYSVSFELSEQEVPGQAVLDQSGLSEEEIVQRLMSELDAEELPAGQLAQGEGGD